MKAYIPVYVGERLYLQFFSEYVCVYIYTCTHTYPYVCVCVCVCIYIYIHTILRIIGDTFHFVHVDI